MNLGGFGFLLLLLSLETAYSSWSIIETFSFYQWWDPVSSKPQSQVTENN